MMISTRGRYALRVMIDLALQDPEQYVPLKAIAARQEISEKYLENIIAALVKEKYLVGIRGKKGGYKLNRLPEEYTVGSILRVTEGSLAPVDCLKCHPNQCSRADRCLTLPMWQELNATIENFFDNITLDVFVKRAGQLPD